jgi:hypothetical protein
MCLYKKRLKQFNYIDWTKKQPANGQDGQTFRKVHFKASSISELVLHFTALTKQDGNNKNCCTDRFQNLEMIVFQ